MPFIDAIKLASPGNFGPRSRAYVRIADLRKRAE
jgi:hypothetical protein